MVKDILEVEREIARLLEKIERIEGQVKFLNRQVAESTITVNYYEPYAYEPAAWSLDFMKNFKHTLQESMTVFISGMNTGLIILAMVLPFVIWAGTVFLPIYGAHRFCIKKKRSAG